MSRTRVFYTCTIYLINSPTFTWDTTCWQTCVLPTFSSSWVNWFGTSKEWLKLGKWRRSPTSLPSPNQQIWRPQQNDSPIFEWPMCRIRALPMLLTTSGNQTDRSTSTSNLGLVSKNSWWHFAKTRKIHKKLERRLIRRLPNESALIIQIQKHHIQRQLHTIQAWKSRWIHLDLRIIVKRSQRLIQRHKTPIIRRCLTMWPTVT